MGKHATDDDNIAFLVHLQYMHCAEAARRVGLSSSTRLPAYFPTPAKFPLFTHQHHHLGGPQNAQRTRYGDSSC
jgi:hypothetical protein